MMRIIKEKSMYETNKGLVIFGIILLAIGLFASFYQVTQRVGQPPMLVEDQIITPYQNIGIISLVAGIILIATGFLYPPRKTLPTLSSPEMLGVFLIIIGIVVSVLSQLLEADYIQFAEGASQLGAYVATYWVLTVLGIVTIIIGVVLIMQSNEKRRLLTPPPPREA
jgi:vacuolar-type H+-ATPase subunit I/STV1